MKSFIVKISSTLAVFLIIGVVLLLTIRLQLISANFWNTVFDNADIYNKSQTALGYAALSQIENKLISQGVDIETLSVGERAALIAQAEMVNSALTTDRLEELYKENIKRITDYANGKSERLYLYTPFSRWGIKANLVGISSSNTVPEEVDINTLVANNPNYSIIKNFLDNVHSLGRKTEIALYAISFVILLLLMVNYISSKNESKISSTANVILTSGIVIVIFSIILKYVGDNLARSSLYIRDPSKLLLGAFIPAFLNEVTKLWVIIAICLAGFGLLIKFIATVKIRRKKTIQARQQKNVLPNVLPDD